MSKEANEAYEDSVPASPNKIENDANIENKVGYAPAT
jgi:hypothetical protein